jgi:citrate lyase subunit beta/citryl-CoA lyase
MQPIARSYLFVPGNRPDRFQKALNAGAHAVIVDLEDGVRPDEKKSARQSVARWLDPSRPVVVRVNAPGTEWFEEDLELCAKPGVAALMLAKAESAGQVLDVAKRSKAVLPQIETARGFSSARDIAGCAGVQRLVFGPLDFQADLGIDGDKEELLFFRSQLVLISRLAGIQPPVEGPTTAINDGDLVRADAARARRLGFGAKLCIHPKQVPIVNECFLPTTEEIEWARKVMKAAALSHGGAVAVDGKMVDRPVILRAERVLSEAKRGS